MPMKPSGKGKNLSSSQKMTLKRKLNIMDFRYKWICNRFPKYSRLQQHERYNFLKTTAFTEALTEHLTTNDSLIQESDVKRWKTTHSWITNPEELPRGVSNWPDFVDTSNGHQDVEDPLQNSERVTERPGGTKRSWEATQHSPTANASYPDPHHSGAPPNSDNGNNTPDMPNLTPYYYGENNPAGAARNGPAVNGSSADFSQPGSPAMGEDSNVPLKKRILFRESTMPEPPVFAPAPGGENNNLPTGGGVHTHHGPGGTCTQICCSINNSTAAANNTQPVQNSERNGGLCNTANICDLNTNTTTTDLQRYTSTPINQQSCYQAQTNAQYDLHTSASAISNYDINASHNPASHGSTSTPHYDYMGIDSDPSVVVRKSLRDFLGRVAKNGFLEEDPWNECRDHQKRLNPPEASFHVTYILSGMEKLCQDYGENLVSADTLIPLIQKCRNVFNRIMKKVELPVNYKQAHAAQVRRFKLEQSIANQHNRTYSDNSPAVFNESGSELFGNNEGLQYNGTGDEYLDETTGRRYPSQVIRLKGDSNQNMEMPPPPPIQTNQENIPIQGAFGNDLVSGLETSSEGIQFLEGRDLYGNALENHTTDPAYNMFRQGLPSNCYNIKPSQAMLHQCLGNMKNTAYSKQEEPEFIDLTDCD